MRLSFNFFLFVVLCGSLFWVVFQFPQDVFLSWGGYEVYTKTPFLLGFIIAFLLLWSFFLGGWRWVVSMPSRWLLWWGRRHLMTEQQLLLDTLIAFEEEDLKKAEKLLKKNEKRLERAPFFFFLQRNWARLVGDLSSEKEALDQLNSFRKGDFFSKKHQVEKAIARQDNPDAILILEELIHQEKGGPWAYRHLFNLYIEQEKFSEADILLTKMSDQDFSEEDLKKKRAYLLYLQALSIKEDLLQREALLRKSHLLDPGFSEVAVKLTEVLKQQGKEKQAQAILEATWRYHPHPDMIAAYTQLEAGELPVNRFQHLKRLTETNPSHPLSYWTLGRAALEAQLWGPAHEYLMLLVVKKPEWAYPLLAQLEQCQHKDWQAACGWLEKGYSDIPI